MPQASVYERLFNYAQSQIQALGLDGIAAANVKKQLLPKVDETLDTLPMIALAPGGRERKEDSGFEDTCDVTYEILVVLIDANNQDYSSKLGTYLSHREKIRKALGKRRFAEVPQAWNTEIDFDFPVDPEALSKNYAYVPLRWMPTTEETRI